MVYDSLFNPPEWMMWGVDNKDGTVSLIATRKLEDFTLLMTYAQEMLLTQGASSLAFMRPIIEMHGKVSDFVIINADSYGEAVTQLNAKWARNG